MKVESSKILTEIREITRNMYRLGWNERNGGNISVLLTDEELAEFGEELSPIRTLPLSAGFPDFAGRYFLVTGTGKYFKNIYDDPQTNLGIVRVSQDGSYTELVWGYQNGGSYTSEIVMHLGAHLARLQKDPQQRVVIHAHPANTVAMSHIHAWDEKEFTLTLWNMITECIVIFPEGVGVLPWMVSSGPEIGLLSQKKFEEYRILIWALHGITAAGNSIDEAFGLIETVEKAAEIYIKIAGKQTRTGIDKAMLRDVAKAFHLTVKEGWLD